MRRSKVELLLSELCVDLGFCLPPQAIARLSQSPPHDIDKFAEAVFEAEGIDVGERRQLWREVRERVAIHFRRWEEEGDESIHST